MVSGRGAAARLGLVRELGTDRFARASQHDAGSERLVHAAQQQLVGQGDQVARDHGESSGRLTVRWMAEEPARTKVAARAYDYDTHNDSHTLTCVWAQVGSTLRSHYDYGGAAIVSYRNS